jgi:hypothetical protein
MLIEFIPQTIAEKLQVIAENEPRVYQSGYNAGYTSQSEQIEVLNDDLEKILYGTDTGGKSYYDTFWDNFQNYGNRRNYKGAFTGNQYNAETFFPKYDIIVEESGYQMMYAWNSNTSAMPKIPLNLKQRLIDCGVTLDTSKATDLSSMFSYGNITHIPTIDCSGLPNGVTTGLFAHCWANLKYIEKIIVHEGIEFKNWFSNDSGLESITIEGTIGQNGFDISPSKVLNKASIESIISHLSDTAADKTVTLSKTAVNNAFTTEQWNELIATKNNWLISLV